MKELFKLAAVIVAEGLEYTQKGLEDIDKQARKTASELRKLSKDAHSLGMNLTKAITTPVLGVTAAIGTAIVKTSKFADSILDLTQISGLSTSALQKWRYAVTSTGGDFNSFISIVSKFQNRLPDLVKGTSDNAKLFKQLGVNLFNASGEMRSMDDLFPELIGALQKIENPTTRNAVAMKVFGKSLDELAPVLAISQKELSSLFDEAEKLGIVLSPEELKKIDDTAQQFRKLEPLFESLYQRIAIAFIPILQEMVPVIQNEVVPAVLNVVKSIENGVKWFSNLHPSIQKSIVLFGSLVTAAGPLLLVTGSLIKSLRELVLLMPKLAAGKPNASLGLLGFLGAAITAAGLLNGVLDGAISRYDKLIDRQNDATKTTYANTLRQIEAQKTLLAAQKEFEDVRNKERKFELIDGIKVDKEFALAEEKYKKAQEAFVSKFLDGNVTNPAKEALLRLYKDSEATIKQLSNYEKSLPILKKREGESRASSGASAGANSNIDLGNGADEDAKKKELEEQLKWDLEYNESKFELGRYTNQKIIEEDELKTEELIKNRDKELRNEIDAAKKELKAVEEKEAKKKKLTASYFEFASNAFNQLSAMLSMGNSNRVQEIENWEQREIEAIQNSTLSEEEKQKKTAEIERKAEARQKGYRRRQAIADKALGLFNVAINTAQAIMKGFSSLPPWAAAVNAVVVGTLGTIQAGLIAAQPIPLQEGAYLPGSEQGVYANVGERNTEEIIFPVEKGIDIMADKLQAKFNQEKKVASATNDMRQVHYHIGTLVADDSGLKEFGRRVDRVMTFDRQRVGAGV